MTPRTPAAVVAGLCLLLLGACGAPVPGTAQPLIPAVVGQDLAGAKAAVRAAGFTTVATHDVLQSRTQLVDANWRVCTQHPGPGRAAAATPVELGVARIEEGCPGTSPTPTTTPAPSPTPSSAPSRPAASRTAAPLPVTPAAPRTRSATPAPPGGGTGTPGGSGSGAGPVVNAGSFCSPAGATGVSKKGKPMVCGPASDGRNRWQGA